MKKTADAASKGPPPKQRRGARFWRVARRGAVVIVALAILARLALPFVLPAVLDSVVAGYGLTARYEALDLSLLGGELTVRRLRVAAAPAEVGSDAQDDPYLELDYALADIDVSALWSGTLRLHRVEVDGLDLRLERRTDGTIALLEHFARDDTEPEPSETMDPTPVDLRSPVWIDALLAQNVRVQVVDHTAAPALETWVETDFRLRDLGAPERPARLSIDVHGPTLLDHLSIEGTLHEVERGLRAELDVAMRGAHPKAAAPWLEALGVTLSADTLRARAHIVASAGPNAADEFALDSALTIEDLALLADGAEEFGIERLEVTAHRLGAEAATAPEVEVSMRAHAPGIASTLTLDAVLAPSDEGPTLRAELRIGGLTLEQLAPHLRRRGLGSTLRDAGLSLRVEAVMRALEDGGMRGQLALDDVVLRDGDRDLASLQSLAVTEFALDAAGTVVKIGEVAVSGLAVPLRRDAKGALHVAGLHTLQVAGAAVPPARPVSQDQEASDASPMRIELSALRVRGVSLPFADETTSPPADTAVVLDLDVDGLALGGDSNGAGTTQASLRLGLRVDGVAEELGLAGTIQSGAGPLDLRAELQTMGRGLTAGPLTPYFVDLGLEPMLEDGRLRASLEAAVHATEDGGLAASARLADVELRDGDAEPLAALEELRVDGVELGADGTTIGAVVVTNPYLRAARNQNGALQVLGLRVLPTPPPVEEPADPVATRDATPAHLKLGDLRVLGARLEWHDAAVAEEVATVLSVDAQVTDFAISPDAGPATFDVTLRADGAAERTQLAGTMTLAPTAVRAQVRIDARGLRVGPLAGYLPPGTASTLEDGRLRAELEAQVAAADAGGITVDVALRDVDYRDGDTSEPLFAIEAARLNAPRLDPAGGFFSFAELSLTGTQITARKTAADRLEMLGLAFATPPDTSAPEVSEAAATANPAPKAEHDPSAKLPRIQVEKLDLELARIRFVDASTNADTPPVDLRLRVFTPGASVLLDAEPEKLDPLVLKVEGAAEPLVDSIVGELRASPWRGDPLLEGDLEVRGLRGSELPLVLPSLAERLDARDLQDGSLTAKLVATISAKRRTAIDLDLSRGFGLEATLSEVAFRAQPDGEVLAGVDEVYVQAPRIAPDGTVRAARLDIVGLRGRVHRTEAGLHALGLTLKPPQPAAEASPEEESQARSELPTEPATEPTTDRSLDPELAVDRLSLEGLDFVYEDTTTEPKTTVPLTGLDVEVENFSTRAFTEPRPIRFALSVTGGDVELPTVPESSSLLSGLLGAATNLATGQGDEEEHEQRPFLDEITAQGQLSLHPEPKGGVRASISSLELNAFRGIAAGADVKIGDGLMDLGFALVFPGDGTARADARVVFDRLDIDEPSSGPISTYMQLPAALDAVLIATRDDTGRIEIPLTVHVENAEIGSGQIASAAIAALGSVLTDAFTSAPLKATGMVTGALGLDGLFGDDAPLEEQRVAVTFGSAAISLAQAERERLRSVADLLVSDEHIALVLVHAFGEADYARAAQLANPSPAQSRALVARLRQRRADQSRERAARGAETRALLGTGRLQEAESAVLRLQALDRELGETELALDKALQLLRPDAKRRTERRTRDTALEIGNRRLEAVRDAITDLVGPGVRDRVEIRRARATTAEGEAGGTVVAIPKARRRG